MLGLYTVYCLNACMYFNILTSFYLAELNDLAKTLDQHYLRNSTTSQHHHPPIKPRAESSPSSRLLPAGAPVWTTSGLD